MSDQIARMVAQYSNAPILWSEPLPLGISNDSVVTDLSDGSKLVVRIMRNQTPDGARREVQIQQAVLAAGLTTARSLTLSSGDVVGEDEGCFFTISHYIPGAMPKDVNEELAVEFGRRLSDFQSSLEGMRVEHTDWLSRESFRASFQKLGNDQQARLGSLCEGTDALFDSDLPTANIHGDLGPENVCAENDRISAIFDFETTEHNIRILDLARTTLLLTGATGAPVDKVSSWVLDGFEERKPLLRSERELFPQAISYAAAACGAWLTLQNHEQYADHLVSIASQIR